MQESGDVNAELFGLLFVFMQHLTRRADEQIAPLGLSSKQWLLLAVVERGFPDRAPTLSEAAAAYGTSRQNVKQIALGLERDGWLHLEPDPADGRATRLVLTTKVRAFKGARIRADQDAFLAGVFAPLSERERRTLRNLVRRTLAHLSSSDVLPPTGK